MPYDFIDQNIVASCLIQPHDDDSFYNPIRNLHTGFAFDGNHYTLGVQDVVTSPWHTNGGNLKASWWSENQSGNPYRGDQQNFPTYGLVLLSPVSMVILDQSTPVSVATSLPLWMQFLLSDTYALANDFNGAIQGFLPSNLCYADGIISVTYSPDPGNQATYGMYPPWNNALTYTPGTPSGSGWVGGSIVTYQGIRYQAIPPTPSTITRVSETAGHVVTLTVSTGSWAPGQQATLSHLTVATWLNGETVTLIAGTTSTSLVFNDPNLSPPHGPVASTPETGTATAVNMGFPPSTNLNLWVAEITRPYPAPYPVIGANSNMVVNIDFTQDSVYLDVAV